MTDLHDLAVERVRLQPPPSMLTDIRRNGRKRLRRLAVGSILASAALSVGVVAAVTGVGDRTRGVDQLLPAVPRPGGHAAPTPSASHAQEVQPIAPAPGGPGAAPAPWASPATTPEPAAPQVDGAVGPTPAPPASPSPSASAEVATTQQPALVSRGVNACGTTPSSIKYCGRVTATAVNRSEIDVVTEVCVSDASAAAQTLTFGSGLEADASASQAGQRVWDWADGKTFSQQGATFTLQPGTCYDWTSQWDPVDAQGNPLPSGTYDVEGDSYARELATGVNSWTTTVTLS